jgi:hypothetical protein
MQKSAKIGMIYLKKEKSEFLSFDLLQISARLYINQKKSAWPCQKEPKSDFLSFDLWKLQYHRSNDKKSDFGSF